MEVEKDPLGEYDANGVELVAQVFACPRCGERRMDFLIWVQPDGEEVECGTSGFVYNLASPNA